LVVVEAQILMQVAQAAVLAAAQVKVLPTTHLVERVHLGRVLVAVMVKMLAQVRQNVVRAVVAVQVAVAQVVEVSQMVELV
jgi:hypothetical protein